MSPPEIPPPISTHKPLPKWKPRDLAEHTEKRAAVDTGCLESIYGLDHQLVTGDLRRISEQTFMAPCLVYECESLDQGGQKTLIEWASCLDPLDQFAVPGKDSPDEEDEGAFRDYLRATYGVNPK